VREHADRRFDRDEHDERFVVVRCCVHPFHDWHATCEPVGVRFWLSLLSLTAGLALAKSADAQRTSNASSCVTCHETQGLRPVLQSKQVWLGRVTVAGLTGASPWLVLLVFGQLVVLTLMLTARVGRNAT
jgi:hypothetical protein